MLAGEDIHAVGNQLHQLGWVCLRALAINQILNAAHRMSDRAALTAPLVVEALIAGQFSELALGVRRLVDKRDDVVSLRRVVDILKKNRALLRREVYVTDGGIPLDPASAEEAYRKAGHPYTVNPDGSIFALMPPTELGLPDFMTSRARHDRFDRWSSTAENRTSQDNIALKGLCALQARLIAIGSNDIVRSTHKFIAHAASGDSRQPERSGPIRTEFTVDDFKPIIAELAAIAAIVGDILNVRGMGRLVPAFSASGHLTGLPMCLLVTDDGSTVGEHMQAWRDQMHSLADDKRKIFEAGFVSVADFTTRMTSR